MGLRHRVTLDVSALALLPVPGDVDEAALRLPLGGGLFGG